MLFSTNCPTKRRLVNNGEETNTCCEGKEWGMSPVATREWCSSSAVWICRSPSHFLTLVRFANEKFKWFEDLESRCQGEEVERFLHVRLRAVKTLNPVFNQFKSQSWRRRGWHDMHGGRRHGRSIRMINTIVAILRSLLTFCNKMPCTLAILTKFLLTLVGYLAKFLATATLAFTHIQRDFP